MACMLHVGFLFGEVQDSADLLVTAVVEPWGRDSSQEQRTLAAKLTDVINRVWAENDGRALQQEAGLISQVLEGCVFGVAYDPAIKQEAKLLSNSVPDEQSAPVRFVDCIYHYHYWFHIGEAHAVRQMLGHGNLPDFVSDLPAVRF